MIERIIGYMSFKYGIGYISQYFYLFIMSLNPIMFELYKLRHFAFFFFGLLLSFANHRIILMFILLNLLSLDYSKVNNNMKLKMIIFTLITLFVALTFGRWHDGTS